MKPINEERQQLLGGSPRDTSSKTTSSYRITEKHGKKTIRQDKSFNIIRWNNINLVIL